MKINRTDMILILLLFLFGIVISLMIYLPHTNSGNYVEVRIDGVTTDTYSLSENRTERIPCPNGGSNQFKIQDGVVYMTEADCPDKVCIDMHGISKSGETIVCLPHKLVLAIVRTDDESPELDAVTGQ